jgi:hypothetical protein
MAALPTEEAAPRLANRETATSTDSITATAKSQDHSQPTAVRKRPRIADSRYPTTFREWERLVRERPFAGRWPA